MTALLEVSDLRVSFGGVPAVRGLSFGLSRGEVAGLVGESGSGKSASALAVLGLLPRAAYVRGSVRLSGRELIGLGDKAASRIRGNQISMVFQDPQSALTPVYTAGAQIAEAVRAHTRVSRERARRRSLELLDLVGVPASRAQAFPHELSGGMRQRVMIAMAIAGDPDVIVADEPTTALDVTTQAQILDLLRTVQRETGAAVLLITHDLGVVAGFADRVMVMYAGRVVEAGSVDDVYYRPRMPYTIGLLGAVPRLDDARSLTPINGAPPSPASMPPGCPFAPRCPAVVEVCRTAEPELIPSDAAGAAVPHEAACVRAGDLGEEIFPVPPSFADASGGDGVVLAVRDLVKHYPLTKGVLVRRRVGVVRAVDGISFEIRQGETLGLVGESGSGKTTTIMEILRFASGVELLGHATGTLPAARRKAARRDVQVVFQDPLAALDPRMPVGDIIAEPLRAHSHAVGSRVGELLHLVGLESEHELRYPGSLSGGQRQRVGIARALALSPKLVVLDEPVSALDVSVQAGVINLLRSLRSRLGLSYLFVSHDLAVVRQIADRVAVMYLGRIVEIGPVSVVYGAPAHPYTRALLSAVPLPDPVMERNRLRTILPGEPAGVSTGCRFRDRCPTFAALGDERCLTEDPAFRHIGAGHEAACHYAMEDQ